MALDPAEQHLRHVEKDVLIPKIMREKAREKCSEQVQDHSWIYRGITLDKPTKSHALSCPTQGSMYHDGRIKECPYCRVLKIDDFTRCCKDSGILMVVKCRKENSALKECLTSYYNDPAFYEECKLEYLQEREEFRRTGIPTKKRLQKLPTSM